MNNFKFENRNVEGFANRAGLYRIWVPLHDDGKAPLVSIWIDPKMTSLKSQAHEEPEVLSGGSDEVTEEIEDSKKRPFTVLLRGALRKDSCA